MINQKEINFFNKYGYLIRKGVLTNFQCKKLKKKLVQANKAELVYHRQNMKSIKSLKDYGMVMVCPMYDVAFANILEIKKLIEPFDYFLEKDCNVYAFTSSSMPPRKGNFSSRIHIDSPRFIKNYLANMGCTIALDDFTDENGATQFLPKSHLKQQAPSKRFFEKNKKSFICKKGSVLYFSGRLFHKGGLNSTDEWRDALTINMCRYWMKPRFNYPILLKKFKKKLSSQVLSKFGFNAIPPSSLNEYYGYKAKKTFTVKTGAK